MQHAKGKPCIIEFGYVGKCLSWFCYGFVLCCHSDLIFVELESVSSSFYTFVFVQLQELSHEQSSLSLYWNLPSFISPLTKPPTVSNPHEFFKLSLHHHLQLLLALSSVNSQLAISFLFFAAYCHTLCHVMNVTDIHCCFWSNLWFQSVTRLGVFHAFRLTERCW